MKKKVLYCDYCLYNKTNKIYALPKLITIIRIKKKTVHDVITYICIV